MAPAKGYPVRVRNLVDNMDALSENAGNRADQISSGHNEMVANALTVDVEDYFQVSAFESQVNRDQWDDFECRVEANTDRLLDLFESLGVKGTFFVLGWVADRYPGLVKRIHQAGHELASHGYWHRLIYQQTPDEFREDLRRSIGAIGDVTGVSVTTYRAPSFSITRRSWWALEILVENGIQVDSSIFPISGHKRYGCADAPQEIHTIETEAGTIDEFPPSSWSRGRFQVPVGGGYFRLFPLALTHQAIQAIRAQGRPAMFYIHPWEMDPDQPHVAGVHYRDRLRHRVGLAGTESKLRRLLSTQPFDTVANVIRAANAPKRQHRLVLKQPSSR